MFFSILLKHSNTYVSVVSVHSEEAYTYVGSKMSVFSLLLSFTNEAGLKCCSDEDDETSSVHSVAEDIPPI